jgi:hypothetical protein
MRVLSYSDFFLKVFYLKITSISRGWPEKMVDVDHEKAIKKFATKPRDQLNQSKLDSSQRCFDLHNNTFFRQFNTFDIAKNANFPDKSDTLHPHQMDSLRNRLTKSGSFFGRKRD